MIALLQRIDRERKGEEKQRQDMLKADQEQVSTKYMEPNKCKFTFISRNLLPPAKEEKRKKFQATSPTTVSF